MGIAVAALGSRPSRHTAEPLGRSESGPVEAIPAAYRALAGQTDPLSAGMQVKCNGIDVPVPLLATPGRAERGNSAPSVALRQFLDHNPFEESGGSVTKKNWLLLSQTKNTLVFGQREGRIGVGAVVTLTKQGSSFDASAEGGCGPVIPAPERFGEPVYATVEGAELVLRWENGSNCGTGPAKTERTFAQVLLEQTATVVHVLLISKPSPGAGLSPANQVCLGVGLSSTTRVRLAAPLGARTLIDDARVPGVKVPVIH